MSRDAIFALLGSDDLPGSEEEQAILVQRIEALVRLNGEAWVVNHRRKLIQEWRYIVERGIIRPS